MLWSLNISGPHEVIYWYRQHFQTQSMLSQCCQLCSCCCCCQHCPHQGGPFPLLPLLCQTLHLISRILPCLFCHCSQRHCAFCSLCFLLMRGTASSQFGPPRATCPPRIRPAGGVPTHRPRPWGQPLQSLPREPEVAPAPHPLAMVGQQEALLGRSLCLGNPPTHAVDDQVIVRDLSWTLRSFEHHVHVTIATCPLPPAVATPPMTRSRSLPTSRSKIHSRTSSRCCYRQLMPSSLLEPAASASTSSALPPSLPQPRQRRQYSRHASLDAFLPTRQLPAISQAHALPF